MKTLSEARREALARRRQRRAELRKAPPDAKNQLQPFGRLISEIPLSVAVEAAIQKEFDTLELWRRVGFPLPVDISVLYEEKLKEISPQKFSRKDDRRTRGLHGVMLGGLLAEREVTMEFVFTIYDKYMDLVKTTIDKLDKSALELTEEACRNLAIATLAALANLVASRILYEGRKDSVDESKALQDLANAIDKLSDALSVVSSHPTLSTVFNDFVRNKIKEIIESSGIKIAIESDVSKATDLHRMFVDGSVSTIMLILLQAVQLMRVLTKDSPENRSFFGERVKSRGSGISSATDRPFPRPWRRPSCGGGTVRESGGCCCCPVRWGGSGLCR